MKEKKLNSNQQKAAQYMGEALCILASAGCGKTTVLVAHYLELLRQKKLRPSQIVVTTFSEKSAADIKQKILQELQNSSDKEVLEDFLQAPICTLHSLAGRILRDTSLLLGMDPHFEILDENESATLKIQSLREVMLVLLEESSPHLQSLIHAYGWQRSENELFHMLDKWPEWKDLLAQDSSGVSEKTVATELKEALREVFLKALQNYELKKKSREVLDFNDLEEKSIELLQKHPWVVKHYQKQWKAYLIDEFQDTSVRQDLLLSLLLDISPKQQFLSETHLVIVGDPKQSIYGFRGAKAHIFEKYQSMIEKKGGLTVYLDENYRSPSLILHFVNQLFRDVFPNYSSLRGSIEKMNVLQILQEENSGEKLKTEEKRKHEAELLASHVQKLLQEGNSAGEIFLLFRSATPMPLYLKIFREKSLPVFVKSGESLLIRQEIQDLLHAMRVVIHPKDALSWVGLLRSPAFAVSDEKLLEYSLLHSQKPDWSQLHPLAQKLALQDKNMAPTRFLEEYFDQTQVLSLYSADPSLSPKAQNILQFYNHCFEWEREHAGGLEDFLHEIDLLIEEGIHMNSMSDHLGSNDSITFMTIHQSKGLDLPIVVLPDLQSASRGTENKALTCKSETSWALRIPDPKPGLKKRLQNTALFEENLLENDRQQKEEENRIFYVACTRSTKKLILGFLPSPSQNREEIPNARKLLMNVSRTLDGIQWISQSHTVQIVSAAPETFPTLESFPHFSQNRRLHFAVTQLECFLRSPQEYEERFIHNISAESTASPWTNRKNSGLSALERGRILHEALCVASQKNSPLEMIRSLAARHHFSLSCLEDEIIALENTFQEMTGHPALQKILHATEGYSEIPFRLKLEPFVIQGAMDRLIRENEHWIVVDYKTHRDPIPAPEEFEFQLKTYCLAASKMIGKPVQKAQVYFVLSHKTHSYFFKKEELQAHENKLWNLMQEINKFVYGIEYGSANPTNTGLGR